MAGPGPDFPRTATALRVRPVQPRGAVRKTHCAPERPTSTFQIDFAVPPCPRVRGKADPRNPGAAVWRAVETWARRAARRRRRAQAGQEAGSAGGGSLPATPVALRL